MKRQYRSRVIASILSLGVFGAVVGCDRADNPTPVAAPPPPAATPDELKATKEKGKTYDPSVFPRYKKMQESKAKQG
jgi:hypothetical protein